MSSTPFWPSSSRVSELPAVVDVAWLREHLADPDLVVGDVRGPNAHARGHIPGSRPLVLVWGMLNSKDAHAFIAPFAGIAHRVVAIAIPDEDNAIPADRLADIARRAGLSAETAMSIDSALQQAAQITPSPRILILGSLYLAGHVLAEHSGQAMSQVSGTGRR